MAPEPHIEEAIEEIMDHLRLILEDTLEAGGASGMERRVILHALHWQAACLALEAGVDPASLTSAIHAVRAMLEGGEEEDSQAGRES